MYQDQEKILHVYWTSCHISLKPQVFLGTKSMIGLFSCSITAMYTKRTIQELELPRNTINKNLQNLLANVSILEAKRLLVHSETLADIAEF